MERGGRIMRPKLEELEGDLAKLIAKYELDNSVNIPADILAEQIITQLVALKTAWRKLHKRNLIREEL